MAISKLAKSRCVPAMQMNLVAGLLNDPSLFDAPVKEIAYYEENDPIQEHTDYVGTDQKRFYKIEGNRLILRTPPERAGGANVTYYVTWEREL